MLVCQIIYNYYSTPSNQGINWVAYIPAFTLCFAILSYFLEKIISNHSKRKQIQREWYKASLLEPSLDRVNFLFESIKELTYKHITLFDNKKSTLQSAEFLRYKGKINDDFQKLKEDFYTEILLPIFHNYPKIADSATNFLMDIQDSYIELFGGNSIKESDFKDFINILYIEKGKLMNVLKKPLY